MDTSKISENEIQVTRTVNTPPIITTYSYEYIVAQRMNIIKSANDFLLARQAELDEINVLLAECDKLGITTKVMPSRLE